MEKLGKHGTNQHGEAGGGDNAIISSLAVQGSSSEYRVRRLKRDRPDLSEKLAAGEFTLADAERAAGIDPRGRRIWLPSDPNKAALSLNKRFGEDFSRGLLDALRHLLSE